MRDLIDGLLILEKYSENPNIIAEDDIIFIHTDFTKKSDYSLEDIKSLKELYWGWDNSLRCWKCCP